MYVPATRSIDAHLDLARPADGAGAPRAATSGPGAAWKAPHEAAGYLVAVVAVALSTVVKYASGDWLGRDVPSLVYMAAVMVAAWYGGAGPGLLATALATVAGAYLFVAPYETLAVTDPHDLVQLAAFAAEACVVTAIAASMHAARRRAVDEERRAAEGAARRARNRALRADVATLLADPADRRDVLHASLVAVREQLDAAWVHLRVLDGAATAATAPHGAAPPLDVEAALARAVDTSAIVRHEAMGKAVVAAPLAAGERVIGALVVVTDAPLDADGESALHAIADLLVVGLERWRAEQELVASRERAAREQEYLASYPKHSPIAIAEVDAGGVVTYVNPAAERAMPDLRARASGHPFFALAPASQPGVTAREIAVDRTTFRVLAHTTLEGRTRLYGIDVTESKRLEEQLRSAQRLESLGRLAAGVAHDFNNLLTVILTHAAVLAPPEGADEPLRAGLEEIRRAGTRAAELTRQLLSFARRQMITPRVIALDDTIGRMLGMIRRVVGEDVMVTTRFAAAGARVVADPIQIEQVLLNLVVNARDAMPRGGRLTIETSEAELEDAAPRPSRPLPPGAYVRVVVRDTGVGMDEATKARIFEPFFTTKELGRGTGLGLSTVLGIVEQAGGAVRVASDPATGSSFEILLPRTERPLASEPAPAAAIGARPGETILVAEDDVQVRAAARRILEAAGYAVIDASGLREVLALIEKDEARFDLLLTDVVMPQASGPEVAERVRALRPGVKVVFMSGYPEPSSRPIPDGAPFIAKPLTPDSLARKVREVLDGA